MANMKTLGVLDRYFAKEFKNGIYLFHLAEFLVRLESFASLDSNHRLLPYRVVQGTLNQLTSH
jgi:hypothetical protein